MDAIFKKVCVVLCIVGGIITGAFFYNNGENLLHDLILIRLEMDEEGLSGDNRVAGWFESEYESYLQSSDIIFGRDYDYSISGNSGYRLFIYENGLVGLILVTVFYLTFMLKTQDRRIFLSVALISVLCFWVRGYPLWYSVFIPLYVLSCRTMSQDVEQEEVLKC